MRKEGRKIIEACRRLDQLGYVPATDGNLSVRLGGDRILITPSMVTKAKLVDVQLLLCDLDGRVLEGKGKPSTEMKMHLFAYKRRPEINAVVHTHPPAATAFAVARKSLNQAVLPEVMLTVGKIPLAPYATPSTDEVPRSLEPLIRDHNAILLANHGVLTLGKNLDEAVYRMERAEHLAKIMLAVRALGGAVSLSARQKGKLLDTWSHF